MDRSDLVYCKCVNMVCSTRYINYNPVHATTPHQEQVTSWDPTYLLVLLDTDTYTYRTTHTPVQTYIYRTKPQMIKTLISNIVHFTQSRSCSPALQRIIASAHAALKELKTATKRDHSCDLTHADIERQKFLCSWYTNNKHEIKPKFF